MQGLELILGVALLVMGYLWFTARGEAAAWKAQAEAKAPAKTEPKAAPVKVAKAEKEPKQNDELAEARKSLDSLRKQLAAKDGEAKEAREAAKAAKEKAHQQTKQAEGLAARVRELNEKIASAGPVDKLVSQNKELKAALKEAQARAAGAAEPKVVEKVVEKIVTTGDTEAIARLEEAHKREVAELRKAAEGRKTGEAGLREERERVKAEIDGLRKKLSKALNDVDRERRRADHNDKAYLIMKNQLEAALDRAAHVDLSLRRPDALYPGETATPRPKRERTERPAPEVAAEPESVMAEAAPVAVVEEAAVAAPVAVVEEAAVAAPVAVVEAVAAPASEDAPAATPAAVAEEEVADLSDDLAEDEEEAPVAEESAPAKTVMMTGLDLDAAMAEADAKKEG